MEILNNYKHKNSFLVQILVQNYLEQENKDENIKNNRIALLTILKKNYEKLADFSALRV